MIKKPNLKDTLSIDELYELGLKCGLEIHQQLKTHKLFCNCQNFEAEPEFKIHRQLRLSKSELGSLDKSAEFEQKKHIEFIYTGSNKNSCLVELDEEPPHELNKEALSVVLDVASFFNSKILDSIIFMRKIVVDGSNTSGFQRTALISESGVIEKFNVRLSTICLEEDSCKKIKSFEQDNKKYIEYDLSRLGTPLIEISTEPDIKNPIQAKEVAEYIGMILRSTKRVQRGLGTIRQDVNVSIKKGIRTEIKGAQQLDLIPKLIEFEALRQLNLITVFEHIKNQILIDKPLNLTHLFLKTDSKLLSSAINNNKQVFGLRIANIKGILKLKLTPGLTFGKEIASRLKKYGINGMIHSDENLEKYNLSNQEVNNIIKELNIKENDLFILIAEKQEPALLSIEEIKKYLLNAKLEPEVRQAMPDASTRFLRPMPGASRMYPETDVPIIDLEAYKKNIHTIKPLTELYEELVSYFDISINDAKEIVNKDLNFHELANTYENITPKFLIEFFIHYPKDIKKRYGLIIDPKKNTEILELFNSNKITKDAVFEILLLKAQNKEVNLDDFKPLSKEEVTSYVDELIKNMPDANIKVLMGQAMKKFKGKIDGKTLNQIIQQRKNASNN